MKTLKFIIFITLLALGHNSLISSRLLRIPVTLRTDVKMELAEISEIFQIVDSTSLNKFGRNKYSEIKYVVRYARDNKLVLLTQPYDPLPDVTNDIPLDSFPNRMLVYKDIKNDDIDTINSKEFISIDSMPNIRQLYSVKDNQTATDKTIYSSGEALNLIDGKVLPVVDLQKDRADGIIKPYYHKQLKVKGIVFLWDSYVVVAFDETSSKTYHIRTHHTFTPSGDRLMAFIQSKDEPSIENELKDGNWRRIEIGQTYDFILSDQHIVDYGATLFIKTKNIDLVKEFRLNRIRGCSSRGTVYEAANVRGLYISNDITTSLNRSYPDAQFAVILNEDHGTNTFRLYDGWIYREKYPLINMRHYLYLLSWEVSQKIGIKSGYHRIMTFEL